MYRIYAEMCCGQKCPVGIDRTPSFSWKLKSDRGNAEQRRYRLTVFDSDGKIVWDSGDVLSAEVHNIPYEGPELRSVSDYTWVVESAASTGEMDRSAPQPFKTGVLDAALWEAQWIEPDIDRKPCQDETDPMKIMSGDLCCEAPADTLNPCVYFRNKIVLGKPVRQATVLATAHGIYELWFNGCPCGQPLAPGYTAYRAYQEYQCYDVTEHLHMGENVLGAIVADGWYLGKVGLPGIGNQYGERSALLLQLMVTYEDGTCETFGTNEDYRASTGAYLYADLFIGEGYDEGKEPCGWMEPEFDDGSWASVSARPYGYANLKGRADAPAGYLRIKPPKEVFESPRHELIVDAGENISGYISIRGTARKGDRIILEYSEVLDREGNFLKNIIGQNENQTDEFIAGHDGAFYYRPKFTFHGFQYVRVTGVTGLRIYDVEVFVLGSRLERTDEFCCSDARLNQLQDNIFRSQEGNMLYIPTDCPQREKAGWTGDMQAYSPTAIYLMDMEAFLRKWLANMRIEQAEDGQVPHMIPDIPSAKLVMQSKEICSAGWADACVILPYRLYQAYGDIEILRENYDMMLKWMAYVENKAASEMPDDAPETSKEYQKYLWNTGFHYGDWLIPSLSKNGVADPFVGAMMTKEMVAPAMFAYTTRLMSEICQVLGDEERSEHFRALNRNIREAYAHVYVTDSGRLKVDLQGIYVLALQMDLIPEPLRERCLDRLVELIRENGGCLDTGFLSMPFLLDVLYENGRKEEAWQLLFQEKCPSWLYEVGKGANTIWESWTNIAEDGTRNNSSYNHFSFGCVGDFMYRRILGLTALTLGYRRIGISPALECGLSYAKGSYECVYGEIRIAWSKAGQKAVLDITIPPCVTADISFGDIHTQTGSGSYHFETKAD